MYLLVVLNDIFQCIVIRPILILYFMLAVGRVEQYVVHRLCVKVVMGVDISYIEALECRVSFHKPTIYDFAGSFSLSSAKSLRKS